MAEFSRIQVTPPEEEDIVIIAGAVEEPESKVQLQSDPDDALVVADDGPATAEDASVEGAMSEKDVAAAGRASAASRKGADYRETTLDDLQRTRMSGVQKAIIALAIVAVVAFIIWYVLLR